MKSYASYKPSGVPWLGEVPAHWQVEKVKFQARLRGEKAVGTNGARYVGMEHVLSKVGKFNPVVDGTQEEAESTVSVFSKGDVLFGKLRPYLAKCVVADIDGVCSSEFLVLSPSDEVVPAYLNAAMLMQEFIDAVDASTYGAKMPRADWGFIGQQRLPLPPPDEQQAIADYLDVETARIDTLIHEKDELIGLLREWRQSVVAEAVTKGLDKTVAIKPSGVPWLGDVPAHWAVEKLKFFVGFAGGGTPSKDNPAYWEGAIPWVSPKDMKRPRISETEDYITEEGQLNSPCVLIPPMSVLTVVRSGILQHSIPVALNVVPVALNQDMKALLLSERADCRFLAYEISGCQKELREAWVKQGATVESIEHQRMADSQLALPPLQEQQAIADYLDTETAKIDDLIAHTHDEIALLKELRAATIADAVLGRIDVRGSAKTIAACA